MGRVNRLYQVYDRVAQMVVGGIMVFKSDGPAVRAFNDGLAQQEALRLHAQDYDLVLIGEQLEDGSVVPPGYDIEEVPPISFADMLPQIVATGAQWKASVERDQADPAQMSLMPVGGPRA